MSETSDYPALWAKVLKALKACNNAPRHRWLAAFERYSKACKAAAAARPKRGATNEQNE
jgi:hypothetical protein